VPLGEGKSEWHPTPPEYNQKWQEAENKKIKGKLLILEKI
jgi:hypothetical protein